MVATTWKYYHKSLFPQVLNVSFYEKVKKSLIYNNDGRLKKSIENLINTHFQQSQKMWILVFR